MLSEMLPQALNLVASASGTLQATAKQIAKLNDRGLELTRQLLEFTDHHPLVPKAVDVNAVITGLCPLLDRTIATQSQLNLDLASDMGLVLVDATLLEEMILTLVLNAKDHAFDWSAFIDPLPPDRD